MEEHSFTLISSALDHGSYHQHQKRFGQDVKVSPEPAQVGVCRKTITVPVCHYLITDGAVQGDQTPVEVTVAERRQAFQPCLARPVPVNDVDPAVLKAHQIGLDGDMVIICC